MSTSPELGILWLAAFRVERYQLLAHRIYRGAPLQRHLLLARSVHGQLGEQQPEREAGHRASPSAVHFRVTLIEYVWTTQLTER